MRGQDWARRLAAIGGEAASLWQNGGTPNEWNTVVRTAAIVRRAAIEELSTRFDPDEPRRMAAAAICALSHLPEQYRRYAGDTPEPSAVWLVKAHAAFPACTPIIDAVRMAYRDTAEKIPAAVYRAAAALHRATDAYIRLQLANRQ